MSDPRKINLLVADGRKLLREGLCLLLEQHADLRVIAEADEARAAVKLARALPVQVVILNLSATGPDDIDVVRAILQANPSVSVIALALQPSAGRVREILEAGATGCLNKESAGAELVTAIRLVRTGQVYLSPGLVHSVVTTYVRPSARDAAKHKPLAPREREILRRIAEGQITKQIAADLNVGTKTVETHRRRIMEKLNVYTVAELTKHAVREGLTSLEPHGA
ncbi:MAG TPA: response regulator transcription factor [Tepidisphaeraceae bacterium]|jgi:DNA-binding NarL/FixJ family response regulator|nr:response regulator transcription factor [Tepidisphaeraceae bacterium]